MSSLYVLSVLLLMTGANIPTTQNGLPGRLSQPENELPLCSARTFRFITMVNRSSEVFCTCEGKRLVCIRSALFPEANLQQGSLKNARAH